MFEGPELNEPEIQRKNRRRDDQPKHDPGETGSRKRCKDKINERPSYRRKSFIDGLIDPAGFLCEGGRRC